MYIPVLLTGAYAVTVVSLLYHLIEATEGPIKTGLNHKEIDCSCYTKSRGQVVTAFTKLWLHRLSRTQVLSIYQFDHPQPQTYPHDGKVTSVASCFTRNPKSLRR